MKSKLLRLATGEFLVSLKFQAISACVATSMIFIFIISSHFKSLSVTFSEFLLLPHLLHSCNMEFSLSTYSQHHVFVGSSAPPDSFPDGVE